MESQPQNPEFRINPENFYPWALCLSVTHSKTRFMLLFQTLLHYPTKSSSKKIECTIKKLMINSLILCWFIWKPTSIVCNHVLVATEFLFKLWLNFFPVKKHWKLKWNYLKEKILSVTTKWWSWEKNFLIPSLTKFVILFLAHHHVSYFYFKKAPRSSWLCWDVILYKYHILERVLVENIIPRNVIINRGAAKVDNHISRDDFFD